MSNRLFDWFNMLALGDFIPWGCGDILFEDTRDPVLSFVGALVGF